jgi:hypothetical protein
MIPHLLIYLFITVYGKMHEFINHPQFPYLFSLRLCYVLVCYLNVLTSVFYLAGYFNELMH